MAASLWPNTSSSPEFRESTVQHADRVSRLYSAWHSKAGIAAYSALRDESLALCEQTDAWVGALHFVTQLAYPEQMRLDKTWKDFTAVVKTAEIRRETTRRTSKQASNEANRQRNITLLCALWSPQVVSYYSWDSASQSQLNTLRACAERFPRFKDQFRPRLNHVLLERHCLALLSSHTKTLNEAVLQPHRDLDMVLSKNTPLHRSKEKLWTKNRDGNIAIDSKGTTLSSVRPQHYHLYLLRLDAHGLLCPRTGALDEGEEATHVGIETPRTYADYGMSDDEDRDAEEDVEERSEEGGEIGREEQGVMHVGERGAEHGSANALGVPVSVNLERRVGDNDMDDDLPDDRQHEICTECTGVAQDSVGCATGNLRQDAIELERWDQFLWSDSPIPAGDINHTLNSLAAFEMDWDFHQTFLESSTRVASAPNGGIPSNGVATQIIHSPSRSPDVNIPVSTDPETNSYLLQQHATTSGVGSIERSSMLSYGTRASSRIDRAPQSNTWSHIHTSSINTLDTGLASENIESIIRDRYRDTIHEYINKIAKEARETGAGVQRVLRAQWLRPDVQMASIYTCPQSSLPSGTAPSIDQADAIYFTAAEHLEQVNKGAVFLKPVILKESFTDAGMHKFEDVVDQIQDTYDGSMIHVRWLDESQPIATTCAEVVQYLRTNPSVRPARGLNLRSLRKCHRPTFTLLQRFRILETLMTRVRDLHSSHGDNNRSSLDDTDRSLSFSTVNTLGAFSGPRLTTASGSWVRILDGISLYAIASVSGSGIDSFTSISQAPTSNLKLLVLERDDVLILPPGLSAVFAVHSPTNGVAEGGFLWDELNILKTLDQALLNPLHTDLSAQNLRRLVEQLADLLRQHSGRFCTSGNDFGFLEEFEAILSRFNSSHRRS